MVRYSDTEKEIRMPIKNFIYRWLMHPWFIPACLVLGLLIRMVVVLLIPVEPMSDSAWYVARAEELAAGRGYQEGGFPTAYWPVGWPLILAFAITIFKSASVAVVFLNLVSITLTMLLIVWFGRHVAKSELVARVALLSYVIYLNHIVYAGVAATETFYTAVTMAAFALLISGRSKLLLLVVSGLLFGIATLVKPQTLLFPFGAVIALGLVFKSYEWRSVVISGMVVYICLLAVVLPWSFRNLSVLGDFVLVSTNGGTALLMGANDEMTGDHFDYQYTSVFTDLGIPWEERVERQVELNHKQKVQAVNWMAQNKASYLAWMPIKIIKLWLKDTDGFWSYDKSYPSATLYIRGAQIINQVFYACTIILALCCSLVSLRAMLLRDEKNMTLGLLFCMPVFVSLLAAIFTGQIRYHFPAMPYVLVAAAWMIVNASTVGIKDSLIGLRVSNCAE